MYSTSQKSVSMTHYHPKEKKKKNQEHAPLLKCRDISHCRSMFTFSSMTGEGLKLYNSCPVASEKVKDYI